jgi:uncharacterized protein (TIGR00251 family)
MRMSPARKVGEGTALRVHVSPNATQDAIEGFDGRGVLRVRVAAPPIEGRANHRLLTLLAARLGLPRAEMNLRAGARSRRKTIQVASLDTTTLRERLEAR